MKKIFVILRAYSWPASMVPVLIGSAIAHKAGVFSRTDFVLTLLSALSLQSGANLANTYFDFRNGVDQRGSSDDRALVDGLITPPAALRISITLFTAAAAAGIYLSLKRGLPGLPALGAAGFMLAWFYTAGGVRYKYRALGDLGIFLAFGPLLVTGTALIQTGRFLPEALLASLPAGLLITAIVHANNMRDLDSDRGSGVKTLAGLLGLRRAKIFYRALLISAYALTCASGTWPAALSAVSLPSAMKLDAMSAREDFAALVRETAQFLAVFGLLFSAGIWI
jgi:1,4-dihydroxy-2-naphthoate octaprenyltransferase